MSQVTSSAANKQWHARVVHTVTSHLACYHNEHSIVRLLEYNAGVDWCQLARLLRGRYAGYDASPDVLLYIAQRGTGTRGHMGSAKIARELAKWSDDYVYDELSVKAAAYGGDYNTFIRVLVICRTDTC